MSAARANGERMPFARRLVAIAFTDIVNYSALMAEDEDGTHARWMAVLRNIIAPKLKAHSGHLIKSTGDGILAEFASVLHGVAWGRDVQETLRAHEADEPGERPLELRIAIHLCDVIEEDSDIYGDGVNIAARLQQFAPPGGVIMSEVVYDIVRVAIDLEARDLGHLSLKNMARPIRAYAIEYGHGRAAQARQPGAIDQPSIAVLPLHSPGIDPAESYFGEGIVEDIVVSLSGLRELMVIARASTLAYGAQQPDPRDVGRTLGVRYVLFGTVRRSAERIRVSIQLCDARSGANLWADSYRVPPGDLFDVQDQIVEKVVAGIAPNVRAAELRQAMRKKPESFSAYDHTLRALECMHSLDRDTFMLARGFLEQAIAIDPVFAMPVAWMARWYSLCIGQGWSSQLADDAAEGVRLARKAIELDQQNALALATFGHLRSFLFHDCDTGLVFFERARTACPSSALAWILASGTLCYVGRGEEAIRSAERGLRLSPSDRSLFFSYFFLGLAHYSAGAYEEAIKWSRMSYSENPRYTANLRLLAVALAAVGKIDDARGVAQMLLDLEPGFSTKRYAADRQPFQEGKTKQKYLIHLRSAGFPD